MLLVTATPVQMHPIEAWDLLEALSRGSDAVLGGYGSLWRKPRQALELLLGTAEPPEDELNLWGCMPNPLPPANEGPDYSALRRSLNLTDDAAFAPGGSFDRLKSPERARIRRIFPRFSGTLESLHPPYRPPHPRLPREHPGPRNRGTVPQTGEGSTAWGRRGRSDHDAYHLAERFCELLGARAQAGFFRTLLLRRVGSTVEAGRRTVGNMLSGWEALDDDEDDENTLGQLKTLTSGERDVLQQFQKALEASQDRDPKYVREKGPGSIRGKPYRHAVWPTLPKSPATKTTLVWLYHRRVFKPGFASSPRLPVAIGPNGFKKSSISNRRSALRSPNWRAAAPTPARPAGHRCRERAARQNRPSRRSPQSACAASPDDQPRSLRSCAAGWPVLPGI